MQDYRPLYGVLDEMSATLDSLIKIEDKKINLALARDAAGLDEILKEEQAQLMRLRGFEKKRESALAAIGCGGMTFSEIIAAAPENELGRLEKYFTEMSKKTAGLREQIAVAQRHIEHNIDMLGILIDEIETANMDAPDGGAKPKRNGKPQSEGALYDGKGSLEKNIDINKTRNITGGKQ